MFSATLSLALAAFAPVLPVSAVVSGAAIATCFAPEEDCTQLAVRAIDNGESEILGGADGLRTGAGIVEALLRAKERNVDVRLIADKTTACKRASDIKTLPAAGVPIWVDDQARVAYAKTIVIDGTVTLIGSMNWINSAAANSEDMNVVSSSEVAAVYAAHWRERLGLSVRLERREDWCRASAHAGRR